MVVFDTILKLNYTFHQCKVADTGISIGEDINSIKL